MLRMTDSSISLQDLLRTGTETLRTAECEAPARTARWILEDLLDLSRTAFLLEPERPVAPSLAQRFQTQVEQRAAGIPLQHILGYAEFCGLRVHVTPDVLIPRPETEDVAVHALRRIANVDGPRVLDVGTGSGCIALALKHERPQAAVTACDVSPDALDVAQSNGERLNLAIDWRRADVLADDFPQQVPTPLDLVVSNPPYIPSEAADTLPSVVHDHDPHVALFAGDDPLRFYRALAHHAPALLAPRGWCVVETHADYAEDVASVFLNAGLAHITIDTDFAGQPRIVEGQRPSVASA